MKILVTGATGYIGSHTVLELLEAGHEVVGVDNLVNSARESLRRVEALTGCPVAFIHADIRERDAMTELLVEAARERRPFDAVMHFAGLKVAGESIQKPLAYYENNIGGTLALTQAMEAAGVRCLIVSSSAAVYGVPDAVPVPETASTGRPGTPYGTSKLIIEQMLDDLAAADSRWSMGLLRYFNPVGAHPSGEIGEDPRDTPSNLVPCISKVAAGRRDALSLLGDDYPTADGTGVRDYIHVVDLARGHIRALQRLTPGCHRWNLGTGRGYSVREAVAAFERASGQSIPVRVAPRRRGDVAECYADPTRAQRELGWQAEHDLDAMMRDAWHWQRRNPEGYG